MSSINPREPLPDATAPLARRDSAGLTCHCPDCELYRAVHGGSGDAEGAMRELAEQLKRRYGMRLFGPGAGSVDPAPAPA